MQEIVTLQYARENGLKRYFTGKPCKRGHIAERKTCSKNCTQCDLEQSRGNPKKLAYMKEYTTKNKERISAYHAAYYERNAEKIKEYSKGKYQEKRPAMLAQMKEWRASNKDAMRQYSKARKARNRCAEGAHTAADIRKLEKMQRMKCAYCRSCLKGGYHLDHIVPLALGGTNWAHNLQLLCQTCNLSKGAKPPELFAQQNGRLL